MARKQSRQQCPVTSHDRPISPLSIRGTCAHKPCMHRIRYMKHRRAGCKHLQLQYFFHSCTSAPSCKPIDRVPSRCMCTLRTVFQNLCVMYSTRTLAQHHRRQGRQRTLLIAASYCTSPQIPKPAEIKIAGSPWLRSHGGAIGLGRANLYRGSIAQWIVTVRYMQASIFLAYA